MEHSTVEGFFLIPLAGTSRDAHREDKSHPLLDWHRAWLCQACQRRSVHPALGQRVMAEQSALSFPHFFWGEEQSGFPFLGPAFKWITSADHMCAWTVLCVAATVGSGDSSWWIAAWLENTCIPYFSPNKMLAGRREVLYLDNYEITKHFISRFLCCVPSLKIPFIVILKLQCSYVLFPTLAS